MTETAVSTSQEVAPPHPLKEFWEYFSENHGALVGMGFIVVTTFVAVFANWIAPHNPFEQ